MRTVATDKRTLPTDSLEGDAYCGSKRPRILHLLNYFEAGGTERQAVELLKRLDARRFEIHVAALQRTGPLYQEVAPLFPSIPEFPLTSFYDVNAFRQVLRLRKLIKEKKIDIVHVHEFYAGVLATLAIPFTHAKVIASQRNMFLSERCLHKWGQKAINRFADRILVNAEAIRKHIISEGSVSEEKIVVIHNGIRLQASLAMPSYRQTKGLSVVLPGSENQARRHGELCDHLGVGRDSFIVGIVANLRPVKNHSALISAASQVVRIHHNVHFVLVGEGESRSQIEAQVARCSIRGNVHLLGHRDDTATIVSGFDLAVMTSLHEGLPNAVMEAMAAGLPVVATAVGGTPELIRDGDTGFLISPGDVVALTDRIIYLLGNKDVRDAVGSRAHDFVMNHFSMDRMVNAVERLYEQVLMAG